MDKDRQARFPLPDRKNWTRVRFFLIDHFTGFKYGEDDHAVAAAFLVEMPKDSAQTSAACVQKFEEGALPKVSQLGGKLHGISTGVEDWKDQPLVVRKGTGSVTIFLKKYNAALAWTGYPAYPGKCLVYAVAVPWDGHRDLAEQVRNKWSDGFQRFRPLTAEAPFRH